MADRLPRQRLPRRALLPLLLGLAFAPPGHADIKFTPSVMVRETWTDNVALAPEGQERSEFVTELTPGFIVDARNRRMELLARYQYHRYFYAKGDTSGTQTGHGELQADLKSRLVDDLLFLDASAMRGQQAVSAFGPRPVDNAYLTNNRADVSTWRISPYLTHRFGSTANLLARYSRDSVKSDRIGYGDSRSDALNIALGSPEERRFGWNLRYDRQLMSEEITGDSSFYSAQAGLAWRALPSLTLTASGGYDAYDYNALGGSTRGKSWNVGYQYTPSPRTYLSMSVGHRFFGASRALAAMHRSRHTVWNLSFDEGVTTSRSQFLLPSTLDTSRLLDNLFLPTYPDPELRRQAVEAYLRLTGLPPVLANDVNYLSNRYLLQRRFVASAGMSGVRSTLLLSLYDTRRDALSVGQADSLLLGTNVSSLNDNTRQRGITATASYRLSSRGSAFAIAELSRARSETTDISLNNRSLRIGLNRQFERKLQGTLEVRRVAGSTYGFDRPYTENAVAATLSMTL